MSDTPDIANEKSGDLSHQVVEIDSDQVDDIQLYGGISTSMNVAIGFIAEDLKFEHPQVQWIQSAFQLSSGCLLLLFVPLSDHFGARSIVLFGGSFFCVWAIACANAKTAIQFIIFRALEGAGICAIIPSGFGVLSQMLPLTEGKSNTRGILLATFAAGAPLGSGLGTIFGGLPTQYSAIEWRGIFAVLAGIAGASTILAGFVLPPSKTVKVKGGVDYVGAALVTIALTLIVFCLSQGPAVGWSTGYIIGLLVVGILTLFLFGGYEWWLERQDKTPMLRLSNFARGRYAIVNVLGMVGFGCFITWDYWAGLMYAQVLHYDAKNIMVRYLPQSSGGLIGGPFTTLLLRRFSTQLVFMFGCLCATFGALIFALAEIEHTYWNHGQFFAFFLSIIGASVVYQSGMLYCVSAVVPSEMSAAGGLFQVMTMLAASFGIVFSTIVGEAHKSAEDPIEMYTYGCWTAVAFGMFAFFAAIPGMWGIGILYKTGETARVDDLVAHHHEDDVIHPHHHRHQPNSAG